MTTLVFGPLGCGAPDGTRGDGFASNDPGASPLRVAIPLDGGPLNPYSGSSSSLLLLIYDKLFAPSPYVEEPFPSLAAGAEQVDSLTWRVTLRPGVAWHDGEPFDADDVVFTYRFYRDGPPTRYAHHVSEVPRIDEIVAEDSLTVRFECGYPCPTLARITLADLPVIPEHIWSRVEAPREFEGLPVGTGPYRLVEYLPDRLYRLEANPGYYLGPPAVESLVLPIIPNPSTALLALRTGQIDAAAHEVPPELQESFAAEPGIELLRTSALTIVELRPNYRVVPFVEPRFRAALSRAVDRERLVEVVLLGQGRPGVTGYPHPDSPWTDPTLSTPFDPDSARALLDAAGFADEDGDGVLERSDTGPLRMRLAVSSAEPTFLRTAELLREQFRDLGIELRVETMESAAMSERIRAGDYELFLSEIGAHGVADPDQFIMSHRSGYLWSRDIPYPAWDSLFGPWRAAATVEARREVSFRMQRLFNRQPTSIALYYPEQAWPYRPAAYDGWRESLGYGIVHKWSFVQPPSR